MTEFVRVTWPNDTVDVFSKEEFFGTKGPRMPDLTLQIWRELQSRGTITLINDTEPGKRIRVDLIYKGALN